LRHDAVTVMDPTNSRQEFDQTLHHEKLSAVVRERFCARRACNSPLCATALARAAPNRPGRESADWIDSACWRVRGPDYLARRF
jgi:hypothetical protein